MKKLTIALLSVALLLACKNETPSVSTATTETPPPPAPVPTNLHPIVEYYETPNRVPIYNGFVDADTLNVASGNKYVLDVVNYELWQKFLYLDRKYELQATAEPDTITADDLGAYHKYLLRISMMPKPLNFQNAQTVEVRFSDTGVPAIHRTDFLNARLEGWNMQFSTKNFAACTKTDLPCKAEQVLESVVGSMFR